MFKKILIVVVGAVLGFGMSRITRDYNLDPLAVMAGFLITVVLFTPTVVPTKK